MRRLRGGQQNSRPRLARKRKPIPFGRNGSKACQPGLKETARVELIFISRIPFDLSFSKCSYCAMISTSTTAEVARGVFRLLLQGNLPILEFTLPNGRRLDVAALGPGGEMLGVEIKVALADLRGDGKWPEYLDYCDLFYFAIPPDFPPEHVPAQTGLMVADRYGGAIVKPAEAQSLHASRRKSVTLSFAKVAAERLG